ncbi:MAG: twin-arginine translocase TatA/TatE family subunit [Alphaproteobacteria bacterium HGW-Alphaproteobacteria-12]|nr:MAG: twin-arginine translocase TatA/TatE family subunit [Alphaproteobacteria bacterium HGW-Alphaproteobacteria-12]
MPGWTQILIVLVLIVLLFGRGKISGMMGDVAKGIRSFKKGLADEDEADVRPEPKTIDATVTHEKSAEEKNKASHI